MAASLVGIELENGGVLIRFVQTTVESGGAVHVQEARYPPKSRTPPYHRHPRQDEHFEIIEGALKFRIAGEDRIVRAGDHVDIPKGTFHRAHNPHEAPALVIWETRPALRTAEFFFAMDRATLGRSRPRLIDAAAILTEYSEEFELARPRGVSGLVQRVMFGCLAPFGRRALRPPMR